MAMLNKRRVSMVCQLDTSTVGWVNWTNKKNSKTLLLFHQPNGRGRRCIHPAQGDPSKTMQLSRKKTLAANLGMFPQVKKGALKPKENWVKQLWLGLLLFTMVY